jgi:hypothetical protein
MVVVLRAAQFHDFVGPSADVGWDGAVSRVPDRNSAAGRRGLRESRPRAQRNDPVQIKAVAENGPDGSPSPSGPSCPARTPPSSEPTFQECLDVGERLPLPQDFIDFFRRQRVRPSVRRKLRIS